MSIDKFMTIAKKADRRHTVLKARLKSFAIWKRLLFYPRFNRLRKSIDTQMWIRFGAVRAAIAAGKRTRKVKSR